MREKREREIEREKVRETQKETEKKGGRRKNLASKKSFLMDFFIHFNILYFPDKFKSFIKERLADV